MAALGPAADKSGEAGRELVGSCLKSEIPPDAGIFRLRHDGGRAAPWRSSSMIGSIAYGELQVRLAASTLYQLWIICFPERGCTINYRANFIGKRMVGR